MVAGLQGSVVTGTKEDETSTRCVWAAGLHRVRARPHLARVFKLVNHFFNFPNFFPGHGKPRITEITGTGACLY